MDEIILAFLGGLGLGVWANAIYPKDWSLGRRLGMNGLLWVSLFLAVRAWT